ncbi:MAG: OpgC domain-containing protein [Acetobacteraceae bacterium]|nr:OpgC domain-containing protein [Acetobacteraceae bacterium]
MPPAPPPRDRRLDVLRGWMQLSIFVSHVAGTSFGWFIHAAWGLSDSSEQFLFLSGFGLGSVFALKQARDGARAALRDLAQRTRRLWLTHLTVLAAFGAMVLLVDRFVFPGEATRLFWSDLFAEPWLALPAAFGLHQPEFMGILPSFLFGMVLLPALMGGLDALGARVMLLPVLLYLAVQVTGWMTPAVAGEFAFDPLAWQLLFLLGAFLGRRALLEGRALPDSRAMTAGAAVILGLGLLVRLWQHGFLPGSVPDLDALMVKAHLAPARLLHALALAWLVARLLPSDAAWLGSAPARWLAAIGRHSLNVFAVGLFLSYGASLILRGVGCSLLLDAALVLAGCTVLGALAARWDAARVTPRSASPRPIR